MLTPGEHHPRRCHETLNPSASLRRDNGGMEERNSNHRGGNGPGRGRFVRWLVATVICVTLAFGLGIGTRSILFGPGVEPTAIWWLSLILISAVGLFAVDYLFRRIYRPRGAGSTPNNEPRP